MYIHVSPKKKKWFVQLVFNSIAKCKHYTMASHLGSQESSWFQTFVDQISCPDKCRDVLYGRATIWSPELSVNVLSHKYHLIHLINI